MKSEALVRTFYIAIRWKKMNLITGYLSLDLRMFTCSSKLMNCAQNTNVSALYMSYERTINIFSLSTHHTSILYLAAWR